MNQCRFENMSHDCLGIFCRFSLFYLFTKKYFESERERRRKKRRVKKRKGKMRDAVS